jgi:ubiquinone/menaquinone biosynthesis C-methylase UbiE
VDRYRRHFEHYSQAPSCRVRLRILRRVGFSVGADAYDRFMGRYSALLAPAFADFAAVIAGKRALDVGCGPGALTGELVKRLGPSSVCAVDPSDVFVAAAQERHPEVDVRQAAAESLPFDDQVFDATLAQLVVHFMTAPIAGLREMARVTRWNGVVAACVWDHSGGQGPLSLFWEAARALDRDVEDESQLAGTRKGHLTELFQEAGLHDVEETDLAVTVEHATFEAWWEPFTLGVGPAGGYVSELSENQRVQLREQCRVILPTPPFALTARAWAARGLA